MEKIMSNNEIKLFTGLSASDAKIEIFNKSMTAILASMLGLKQFDQWNVQSEEAEIIDQSYFRLRSFPIDAGSIVLYRDAAKQYEITDVNYGVDDYDFRKFHFTDEAGAVAYLPYGCVYASYTAGFVLQGTIEITNNDLAAITLSVTSLGVTTVYSFITSGTPTSTQILIGASAAATMTNIATKLGGVGGSGVVTIPLGMTAVTSEVSATPKIVIINPDEMLDELKLALAYMVAGALSDKSQAEGVSAYRIGQKSVNFRDMSEKSFTQDIVKKYLSKYKRALIISK